MQKYIGNKPKKFLHKVEETWNNTLEHESYSGLYEEPEKNVGQAGLVIYLFHKYAFDKLVCVLSLKQVDREFKPNTVYLDASSQFLLKIIFCHSERKKTVCTILQVLIKQHI